MLIEYEELNIIYSQEVSTYTSKSITHFKKKDYRNEFKKSKIE